MDHLSTYGIVSAHQMHLLSDDDMRALIKDNVAIAALDIVQDTIETQYGVDPLCASIPFADED